MIPSRTKFRVFPLLYRYADYKTASYAAKRVEEKSNLDSEHGARPLKRLWRFEETGSSGESDPTGMHSAVLATFEHSSSTD